MKSPATALLLSILAGLACGRQSAQRIENANLGIAATFPGEAKLYKFEEDTPFGRMEWFDLAAVPGRRMGESFRVAVGNLPPGDRGGNTPAAVLQTYRGWLERRFGSLQVAELGVAQGPGFHYQGRGQRGEVLEGVVVVRRGRIHHAQGIALKAEDPRLRALIDGFVVAP